MMLRKCAIAAAVASLVLAAACTPDVVKNSAPPISKLKKKDKPDDNVLPIIPSEQVAIDPNKAAENYRKLLELTPDDETKAESTRRLADLQVQLEDAKGNDGADSQKAVRGSIKLYNDLLYSRPDDPKNDRVFYQLARAYQNVGEIDPAIDTLQRLETRFPQSEYAGDAHFRRGELLFSRSRFEEAEAEYKVVMDLKDATPFFEAAQYKYGWARYKQGNYEGAIETFASILDRVLPPGEQYDTNKAMEGVAKSKTDLARDGLRVIGLSFSQLGGGKAINSYLAKNGDVRFYPLLYTSLGELLLEKRRYTDAAETYAAFIERYPASPRAPMFQSRAIKAYADGGFHDLVAREKERYATTYDPSAPYWHGQPPTPEVMAELRLHMEDLAKHYYAKGQALAKPEAVKAEDGSAPKTPAAPVQYPQEFLTAAKWYKRLIEVFPSDPVVAQLNFMLGESLLNGGRTIDAAQEYMKTAYGYPAHNRTGDAAYAAVLAYEKNANEVPPAQRPAALKLTIDASLKLADTLPQHAQVARVLTRSAESYYELKDYDQSIATAARVLSFPREVDYVLRRSAWSVTADSQFAQKRYPEAEKAYTEELKLTQKNTPAYAEATEQLAAAIYKQGEAARDSGDLKTAAAQFLRVGKVTPTAKIRATSDYDGATMLIQLEDWAGAETVLEGFRAQYAGNPLLPDVDKKLAVAYQKDNKPLQAAQAYGRIGTRAGENADTRREATWLSATLFDQAKAPDAAKAYETYVVQYPRPTQRAMDSRRRLADMSKERGDNARYQYWLRELVSGDETAGGERSDRTKVMAATAALELGRITEANYKALRLTLPVEKSLPAKKQAMEQSIAALAKAADYGYAEITTAATYELGTIYQDFSKALLESDRPKKLSALELEQYNVLIEEQANPFEDKAITTYEANLKRIATGTYDQWVAKSADALAAISPGKYGKREKGEDSYATLK